MKLVNIGFGSMVAAGRVLAIVAPDSAPIKRVIQEARDRGMLIDASYGRKTKAVILMDTDHVPGRFIKIKYHFKRDEAALPLSHRYCRAAFFVERKFAEENGAVCGGAEAPAL